MTAPRGTSRHWTCHRVISRRESPFMVLAKQNILNAKREKRTFCARLLHPQTRLMHPDRTHPSTVIQAYSSNTLKSPSLRTQLASPPYNDKCGARTPDQLSTKKPPLPRLEPMNTLAHRVTVIHWALTVGWPQTPSSPIRSQSRGRFESNLPCAPHPANGVQSAHIWLPIWLCLGHSVGKARHFSQGPATKYYKINLLSSLSLAEVFEARGTGIMTAPRGTSRHWTCHRVISRRESPFMVLAKQNILNAKREKRTFCTRLLHPQTRLMHPDRTHPSIMIQAYSSNTLKSPSLRTQLASPPYNDKCGARTHDQLSTKKRPLPRLEPMNTLAHRVTVIHWALTVGWPQTPSSPIRSQSRGRFESNLPCAPTPGQRCAERPHMDPPIWLCLGYSVGKARHFSQGPATKYYKITSVFPACP